MTIYVSVTHGSFYKLIDKLMIKIFQISFSSYLSFKLSNVVTILHMSPQRS